MSLKITISGHAACGQAIVARAIEIALRKYGSIVNVDYSDHRPSETYDIINRAPSLHGKIISIEMEQLKRKEG